MTTDGQISIEKHYCSFKDAGPSRYFGQKLCNALSLLKKIILLKQRKVSKYRNTRNTTAIHYKFTLRAFATKRLLILPITRIQSNGVCRLTLVNILSKPNLLCTVILNSGNGEHFTFFLLVAKALKDCEKETFRVQDMLLCIVM